MGGLRETRACPSEIALPADDLLSGKSVVFAHPDEVLSDRELSIEDKRSLLASWVSDAFAVENSPPLRQLARGPAGPGADMMGGLKTPGRSPHEAAFTVARSFARRGGKPVARRRSRGSRNDDEPLPPAAGARIPSVWR